MESRPINRDIDRVMERPVAVTPSDYHDRVRWGPVISGLFVALATQLVLTGLGAAIGLSTIANSSAPRTGSGDVGSAVGIWSLISLLISLFVGGWITARACGPMNRNTALLNGAILWATTLALSSWLLSSGVSGLFGLVASNAGDIVQQVQQGTVDVPNQVPNVTAQQTRDFAGNAAKVGWTFALGSLLGLAAAMIGASVGVRRHRGNNVYTE